jgi:hypothetical protein
MVALYGDSYVETHNFHLYGIDACELRNASWVSGWMPVFFLAMLYWVTYFLRNVNLIVVASTVMGWYFNNEGYAYFWIPAMRWGFLSMSGGNAIASATMGVSSYILDRISSNCGLCMALLYCILQ